MTTHSIALLSDVVSKELPYLNDPIGKKKLKRFFEVAASYHIAFIDGNDPAYKEILKEYRLYDYHEEDHDILAEAWHAALFGLPRSPMTSKTFDHVAALRNVGQYMIGFSVNEIGEIMTILGNKGLFPAHQSQDIDHRISAFFICYHQKDDFVSKKVLMEGCASLERVLPKALASVPKYQ